MVNVLQFDWASEQPKGVGREGLGKHAHGEVHCPLEPCFKLEQYFEWVFSANIYREHTHRADFISAQENQPYFLYWTEPLTNWKLEIRCIYMMMDFTNAKLYRKLFIKRILNK